MPTQITKDWSRNSARPLYMRVDMEIDPPNWIHVSTYYNIQSLNVSMSTEGAFTGTITLFDHYATLLNNNVFSPALSLNMRIKFGWADDENPDEIPTFEAVAIRGTPTFSRTGTKGFFEFIQGVASQVVTNKEAGPRSFPAGLLASTIATQIATAYQWDYIIEPSNSTDLLPEQNLGDQTAFEFLTQTLVTQTRNDQNEFFLQFFDQYGVFHFHSPRYHALDAPPLVGTNPILAWKYLYGADYNGDCISFTPTDNIIINGQEGGDDGTIVTIDSQSGAARENKSLASGGPNLNDGTPSNTAGKRWTPHEDKISNTRYNDQPNDKSYLTAKARDSAALNPALTHQHMKSRFSQVAEAMVMGNHRVRINDFVSVRALDFQGYDQFTSGVFQVRTVTHLIDMSGWKTKYTLWREGQPGVSGSDQISVNATSTISDPGNLVLGPPENYG